MPRKYPYVNREISWLSFNERVLQEAEDQRNPLGERLKFIAIFSSNLDEFYRVRVASLRSLLTLKTEKLEKLDFDPAKLLQQINDVVLGLQQRLGKVLTDILGCLSEHGHHLKTLSELNERERLFLKNWANCHLKDKVVHFPLQDDTELQNQRLYLICSSSSTNSTPTLVAIPSEIHPRFIRIKINGHSSIAWLDDAVRLLLPELGLGSPEKAYSIKLTRDADLNIKDEFKGNLVRKIQHALKKRDQGPPCRLLYDQHIASSLLEELPALAGVSRKDLVSGGRYHNLKDFFTFPIREDQRLFFLPNPALPHPGFEKEPSVIAAIEKKDQLLFYPYQRFEYMTNLIQDAIRDESVQDIKATMYRIGSESSFVEALIDAAKNGIRVQVFVEVKARFDEESNLEWAKRLKAAGAEILFSIPGIKVHAKILHISRKGKPDISWLSTGNFNESNAKMYSDISVATADTRITNEVAGVFSLLDGSRQRFSFQHLLVGSYGMRENLEAMIKDLKLQSEEGKPARLDVKVNSLEYKRIIRKLYQASASGVQMRLLVRGICCLDAESEYSTNIQVRSLVGRYLEHARMFDFIGEQPTLYLGSADWMRRNLKNRIEVCFPIYDEDHQQTLRRFFDLQWSDTAKLREVDTKQSNTYIGDHSSETAYNAQQEWFEELKQLS